MHDRARPSGTAVDAAEARIVQDAGKLNPAAKSPPPARKNSRRANRAG
jgi:hypothetical protein